MGLPRTVGIAENGAAGARRVHYCPSGFLEPAFIVFINIVIFAPVPQRRAEWLSLESLANGRFPESWSGV